MNTEFIYKVGGFPFSEDRLDDLQQAANFLENFAHALGTHVILTGCVESVGVVSNGIVCVNGKIYPFVGGAIGTNVILNEVTTQLPYQSGSEDYKKSYSYTFGTGVGQIAWSNFVRIDTLASLMEDKEDKIETAVSSISTTSADWAPTDLMSSGVSIPIRKRDGVVTFGCHLRVDGNGSNQVCTLPVGFRPTVKVVMCIGYSDASTYSQKLLIINTDGTVYVEGAGSYHGTLIVAYTYGLSFHV